MYSLDLQSTQYAKWSQSLMNALVNLHGMNAEAVLESNLPRIVVFGDQSAGKSSLVEGVTGIRVPRDAGTCTRCPMEISMFTTGDSWSCEISLQFKYDADGKPHKLGEVKRVQFGELLTDKSEVELALRRAQAAILNPKEPYESFLEMKKDALAKYQRPDPSSKSKFSRNTISITIHDPNGANLSFLDLPGLITNEAKETIDLVQDLAINEVKKENSLILVTIPMTGDMELQTAVRLAREVDLEGLRTIGVLTKPDAVPKGSSSSRKAWMRVLSGQEQKLKHGYYCVRLPDDDERTRDLTRQEYHDIARKFFEQENPWNTLSDKRRLGIPGLVEDLSRHLTVLIDKALPKIQREVEEKLSRCQVELKSLPPAPKVDASVEILEMIANFSQGLNDMIFGLGEDKSMVQENRSTYEKFRKDIWATVPNFIPFENDKEHNVNSEESEPKTDAGASVSEGLAESIVNPMYLRDVRRIIKRCKSWELPHDVPSEAKQHLIKQSIDLWGERIAICYEAVLDRLKKLLEIYIGRHFKYYSRLRKLIISLIEEKVESAKHSASMILRNALLLETKMIYTQNDHYFNSKREIYLSRFKNRRKGAKASGERYLSSPRAAADEPGRPVPAETIGFAGSTQEFTFSVPNPAAIQEALGALARIGYQGLKAEDLGRLNPVDPFEEELSVMADVMAYFHVAYKRIIDEVPQILEVFLNRAVSGDLQSWLFQKLEIGTQDAPQRLAGLISQDPEITATRTRLQAEISKLKDIQKELRDLGI